jgi:hypothetical protein
LSVWDMVNKLHAFLLVKQEYPSAIDLRWAGSTNPFGPLSAQTTRDTTLFPFYGRHPFTTASKKTKASRKQQREYEVEMNVILLALENTQMPWLVPARSHDELMKKIEEAGANLFPGAKIAGLVPGVVSSPFDAYAYPWDANSTQEWVFEFRARTLEYALTDACNDLEAKCGDNTESHAMLVGIRGVAKTEARFWLVGENALKKLRIVLLVGDQS